MYDNGNGLLAPRIWWSLAYHGHPAPLVLDGGYAKWLEEGRPAELAEPCPINVSPELRQWHRGCTSDDAPQHADQSAPVAQVITWESLYPVMPPCAETAVNMLHVNMWVAWQMMVRQG